MSTFDAPEMMIGESSMIYFSVITIKNDSMDVPNVHQ